MIRFLPTVLFPVYVPVFMVLLSLNTMIFAAVIFFVSFFDPTGNAVYHIGRFWSRMNLFLSFVRIQISGLEHLDEHQPYVVMANHQSHYDVWALAASLPLQLRWVIKKELRHVPFFGSGCYRMGQIFIDRRNSAAARRSLAVSADKFRTGASVMFFPEGTRSRDGDLLPFKKGGFVIALASGVPILPISIRGSQRILPKGCLFPKPGSLTVEIHPPVQVGGFEHERRDELIDVVRQSVSRGP